MATILVVDEEPDWAILLKRVLERDGHWVFTCSDYHDALEKVSTLAPDLVVVDVRPSRQQGLRFVASLKLAKTRLKVLALTCCSGVETGEQGVALDYLVRPVELDTIEMKVRELLGPRNQAEESDRRKPGG